MKQRILAFIILVLSISTLVAQKKETHLFILSGQSNMARFNPEESFIPSLNEKFGKEQVLVIKDAQGGQPIRRWYKKAKITGNETDSLVGDLYDRLLSKIKPEINNLNLKSVTFVWMQGERDAREKQSSVYEKSFKGLLDQLERDLQLKEPLNFVIGRLSDFGINNKNYPEWNEIRDIQVNLAESSSYGDWVDCDDLNDGPLNLPDGDRNGKIVTNDLHYTPKGYYSLGLRYADKAVELIAKNNKHLTWEEMNASKKVAKEAFNDAKFGMFIHWGLYAIPGGIWKGRKIEEYGRPSVAEWIQCTAKIPRSEYAQLAKTFNPIEFDALAIAQLAKDAGMKYLVVTSKHHDGFAMYHSEVSTYNIVDAAPFKRDAVKELYNACKEVGIDFGLYYSHNIDWMDGHDSGYSDLMESGREVNIKAKRKMGANVWDPGPNTFSEYLDYKAYPQVEEILRKFPDLKTLWYDMPHYLSLEQSAKFYKLAYDKQPTMLINERVGNGLGDFDIPGDNKIPEDHLSIKKPWQTVGTTNNSWGYKSYDKDWKSVKELLFWLTEIVSKGGNYMLNIGPDGSGVVPIESVENLRAVGAWLAINGEAIYNTRKWEVTHEGPTKLKMEGTHAREQQKGIEIKFTSEDFWFTKKEKSIYLISLERGLEKVLVKSIVQEKYTVKKVTLLGSDETIVWNQSANGLQVTIPSNLPSEIGYSLRITLK